MTSSIAVTTSVSSSSPSSSTSDMNKDTTASAFSTPVIPGRVPILFNTFGHKYTTSVGNLDGVYISTLDRMVKSHTTLPVIAIDDPFIPYNAFCNSSPYQYCRTLNGVPSRTYAIGNVHVPDYAAKKAIEYVDNKRIRPVKPGFRNEGFNQIYTLSYDDKRFDVDSVYRAVFTEIGTALITSLGNDGKPVSEQECDTVITELSNAYINISLPSNSFGVPKNLVKTVSIGESAEDYEYILTVSDKVYLKSINISFLAATHDKMKDVITPSLSITFQFSEHVKPRPQIRKSTLSDISSSIFKSFTSKPSISTLASKRPATVAIPKSAIKESNKRKRRNATLATTDNAFDDHPQPGPPRINLSEIMTDSGDLDTMNVSGNSDVSVLPYVPDVADVSDIPDLEDITAPNSPMSSPSVSPSVPI